MGSTDGNPTGGRSPGTAKRRRADRLVLGGWTLFLVSALAFVAVGVRDRDPLVIVGGATFLAACVLFLLALRGR